MTDQADGSIRKAIVEPLIAYNQAQTGRSDCRPLVIAVADSKGSVVGGLWGRTAYDWLLVELGSTSAFGYESFGELQNYPFGFARYFMRKALSTRSPKT
jgi:hypothetical protein